MDFDLIFIAIFSSMGLGFLALAVGSWIAPLAVPGTRCMRVGSVLMAVAYSWLMAVEYLRPDIPGLDYTAQFSLGFAFLLAGALVFSSGYFLSRRARPQAPDHGVLPGPRS